MLSSEQDDKENPEREGCDSVVYIHRKVFDHTPFYVGIGSRKRAYDLGKNRRSNWWHRTANKYGVEVEIYKSDICRDTAFKIERELISKLGRVSNGGTLVNMTDGGEGAGYGNQNSTGHAFTPDIHFKAGNTVNAGKAVINVDTNMIFPNASMAARSLGKPQMRPDISRVCRGERKTAGKFRWKFASEPDEVIR